MKRIGFMLAGLTVVAGALLAAPAANAAPWKLALVAQDEDRSSFVFLWDIARTNILGANQLRLRGTSSMTVKITAEVQCKKGDSEASRKVKFTLVKGSSVFALPVPVKAGRCQVELDFTASDPGRVDLLLQYR